MNTLEILYNHYTETVTLSRQAQERRNKEFVILCAFETLSFLMLLHADVAVSLVSFIINAESSNPLALDIFILQTTVWVFILYISIRYCQNTIYVERQYAYITKLEERINQALDNFEFDRESNNYSSDYPPILDIIHFFYTWFSPILFMTINVVKIVLEWRSSKMGIGICCDTIVCAFILLLLIFYLLEMHPKVKQKVFDIFKKGNLRS